MQSDSELVKGLHAEETNRSPCHFWIPFTRYGSGKPILGSTGPELHPAICKVRVDAFISSSTVDLSASTPLSSTPVDHNSLKKLPFPSRCGLFYLIAALFSRHSLDFYIVTLGLAASALNLTDSQMSWMLSALASLRRHLARRLSSLISVSGMPHAHCRFGRFQVRVSAFLFPRSPPMGCELCVVRMNIEPFSVPQKQLNISLFRLRYVPLDSE